MLWMDSIFTLFNWHYVSIRNVTETLSKQTDCNSWFRNSECNWEVLCGEVYIPVPLSWILNIKWNGCSIPLENKTFFFFSLVILFFSLKFSAENLPSLPLVCQTENVFLPSEIITGCLNSTTNGMFLNCSDQKGEHLDSIAGLYTQMQNNY